MIVECVLPQKLGLIFICISVVICKLMMLRPCGDCWNDWCADIRVCFPCRMTAVCPSESSPDGAVAAARAADSRGSGATSTAASVSASPAAPLDAHADSVQAPAGGSAAIANVHRFYRWSQQDSSDINTDDEGTSARRLTPLERLNLDMCQDERCYAVLLMFVLNSIRCLSLRLITGWSES